MTTPEFGPSARAAGTRRLRTSVRLVFVLVFLLLAAVLTASLLTYRSEALHNGERRAENLAFILSDHIASTASAIDTTLQQMTLVASRIGGVHATSNAWADTLTAARSGIAGIAVLVIVDETGIIRHTTSPIILGQSRASTYLFRRLLAEPDSGLVVDTPFRGRSTGQWVIPFGRRLTGPDGKFAGMIVATLELDKLRSFYRTIDVGRGGSIWMLHPEQAVLFREPSRTDATGEIAADNPLLALQRQKPEAGVLRSALETGGPIYLNAYRLVATPQVLITVSLAENEVLAAWNVAALIATLVLGGIALLLIFAWRVIMREIQARAAAEAQAIAQAEALAAATKERAEADAALRTTQARFQSIMDHSPMMVSLRDAEGRFIFINRAYEVFSRQSSESMYGKTVAELRSKEYEDSIPVSDKAVIEGRRAMQWEMTIPKPDGLRVALVVKFPIYDDDGKVVSVGSILADVTDQKRAEAQLAQAQRIEAVGQLTGGIAHDFNNLLTSILLNADVLSSILDDGTRPLAEAIRQASERGAELTQRLLAFGRRQMLEPKPTDITVLLAGMEPPMRRMLGANVGIAFRNAPDVATVIVDPSQLEATIMNLVSNARDAMPNGGQLTVETANYVPGSDGPAENPEIKAGSYVVIAVRDTGSGMPPEVIERAFDPFFTTKDVGKGTGLGLSTVHGFVKQSGGFVRITSEVGVGTVVWIYLPQADVAPAPVRPVEEPRPAVPTGDELILFVEDDPMVRQHTGRLLSELGYQIVTADNAAEALKKADEGCKPDLLFTDLVMPGGMNGRQLAVRLRERWPDLRVLFTSGYSHGTMSTADAPLVAREILNKPYRRSELAARLREALDGPAEPT